MNSIGKLYWRLLVGGRSFVLEAELEVGTLEGENGLLECARPPLGAARFGDLPPPHPVKRLSRAWNGRLIDGVTPILITFNEAPNITRTLDKLAWAQRIIVVDSGSTDGTLEILARYPRVALFMRTFDNFADQCNFGLAQVQTKWALSLDADYELSDRLVQELSGLSEEEGVAGYRVSFVYRIHGRPLSGTLYPPRVVLYRVKKARYVNEGHGHKVVISGNVCALSGVIYHDDRKPLSRWFTSQQGYARLEADYLLKAGEDTMSASDRLRRMAWPAPIVVFFYVLVIKGCLLDGWPGWFYALQRGVVECMIALEVIDRRLSRDLTSERGKRS